MKVNSINRVLEMVLVIAGLFSAGCSINDEKVPPSTRPACNIDSRCIASCEYGVDRPYVQGAKIGNNPAAHDCAFTAPNEATREYGLRLYDYICRGIYTIQPDMLGMDNGVLCTSMGLSADIDVTLKESDEE